MKGAEQRDFYPADRRHGGLTLGVLVNPPLGFHVEIFEVANIFGYRIAIHPQHEFRLDAQAAYEPGFFHEFEGAEAGGFKLGREGYPFDRRSLRIKLIARLLG